MVPYVSGRGKSAEGLLGKLVFPGDEQSLASVSSDSVVHLGGEIAGDHAHFRVVRQRGAKVCLGGPGLERLRSGFLCWRAAADVVLVGAVLPDLGAPHNPLDAYRSEAGCLALPGPDGLWPTVQSERARMGVDDLRAQRLLDLMIARAERADAAGDTSTDGQQTRADALKRAVEMRDRTRDRVRLSLSLYRDKGEWPAEVYSRLRWRAVREAERLHVALTPAGAHHR